MIKCLLCGINYNHEILVFEMIYNLQPTFDCSGKTITYLNKQLHSYIKFIQKDKRIYNKYISVEVLKLKKF